MLDTVSLGWARARLETSLRNYKRFLSLALIAETAIAVAALAMPARLAAYAGLPDTDDGWVRIAGGLVALAVAFQLPGRANPMISRSGCIVGIFGRLWMALVLALAAGSFLWLALTELVLGGLLGLLFLRLFTARLMTHP